MRVDDVYVRQLEPSKGGVCAFDEMFAAEAEIVDLVAGRGEGGVVGAPVDLAVVVRTSSRLDNLL